MANSLNMRTEICGLDFSYNSIQLNVQWQQCADAKPFFLPCPLCGVKRKVFWCAGFCFRPFPLVRLHRHLQTPPPPHHHQNSSPTHTPPHPTPQTTSLYPSLTRSHTQAYTHWVSVFVFLYWDQAKLGVFQPDQCDLMSYSLEEGVGSAISC